MNDIPGNTENVCEYYGRILQDKNDLETSTCKCDDSTLSPNIRAIEKKIDDEILRKE